MKKTLIALALVSLPVAASAEVILYGTIRGGVEFTREGTSAQLKSEETLGAWLTTVATSASKVLKTWVAT